MSFYDIVMLIILGGAIWFGYWKGLAWQIALLAAVVVSYIVAVNFRDPISAYIQAGEPWNKIGAMLILFLGTSLIIWTIYASISKSLKKNELKGFDRQMGAILGAAKGAILCVVVTMFAASIMGERVHDAVHTSRIGPYVETVIWNVSAFVPAEVAKFVDPHLKNYQEMSGHDEPPKPPGLFNTDNSGSSYEVGGQFQGNPSQLPPSSPPRYQGQWQTPATPASYPSSNQPQNNQQQPNNGGGLFGGFGTQTPTNQTTTNQQNQNLNISDFANNILAEAARNKAQQAAEALKQQAQQAAQDYFNPPQSQR